MQGLVIRDHDPDDDLSERDVAFINSSEGNCPMCLAGELIGGPRGGLAQNFRCSDCQSEFNLTLLPGNRQRFVIDGHHLPLEPEKEYSLSSLRSHWGELDNSPPPGVSAEAWAAIEAEATQALHNFCHEPGESTESDGS